MIVGFVSFAIGRIKCFHCNQECGQYCARMYGYSIGVVVLVSLCSWFECDFAWCLLMGCFHYVSMFRIGLIVFVD